jgi:hypothetical protein
MSALAFTFQRHAQHVAARVLACGQRLVGLLDRRDGLLDG